MTKKTYIQLAKDLGYILATNEGDTGVAWQAIHVMCSAMKSDNAAFDKQRFIDALNKEISTYE
jgi:hypothetical protein